MTTPLTVEQVERSLRRLLRGGKLSNIPKRQTDRDILLALAAARLESDQPADEADVNIALNEWLAGFCTPAIDHVTIRRHLVDYGYLRRDAPGRLYKVYAGRLDATITHEARKIKPADIMTDLEAERASRKADRNSNNA